MGRNSKLLLLPLEQPPAKKRVTVGAEPASSSQAPDAEAESFSWEDLEALMSLALCVKADPNRIPEFWRTRHLINSLRDAGVDDVSLAHTWLIARGIRGARGVRIASQWIMGSSMPPNWTSEEYMFRFVEFMAGQKEATGHQEGLHAMSSITLTLFECRYTHL